ncbi:MAG: class I SAM-dependent methyltransferase [Patescibacteria group bacterium]|jgi:ubiquinone/menaquinone biosynthesis C-methylase UbiE
MAKQKIEAWKKFVETWVKVTSPGRPTVAEIKIYEKFAQPILKKKSIQILVLGSTPEIRDMLAKYKNAQITLVDLNFEMTFAMTSLMRKKQAAKKEIWLRSNWLTAPLPKKYFDLIFGDFVICNVPFKFQPQFLNNIKEWLKPNGSFITRCDNEKAEYKKNSSQQFCDLFTDKPTSQETINLFWEAGVCLLGRADKDEMVQPKIFYQQINKYLKNHPNQKISAILKKGGILYPLNATWYLRTEKCLQKLLSPYFKIQGIKFDPKINFIYPDFAPIYQLKPKK